MESDSYSPLLNISVIPQVTYRLAPAIWKKMYNYDQHLYGGGAIRTDLGKMLPLMLLFAVIANLSIFHRTRLSSWCEENRSTTTRQKNAQLSKWNMVFIRIFLLNYWIIWPTHQLLLTISWYAPQPISLKHVILVDQSYQLLLAFSRLTARFLDVFNHCGWAVAVTRHFVCLAGTVLAFLYILTTTSVLLAPDNIILTFPLITRCPKNTWPNNCSLKKEKNEQRIFFCTLYFTIVKNHIEKQRNQEKLCLGF